MPAQPEAIRLKREFRRLRRSLDFAAKHRALDSPRSGLGRHLAEIYGQLGQLWDFLALQCRHGEGYRTAREGHSVCRICGTLAGARERWVLQPMGLPAPVQKRQRLRAAKVSRPRTASAKSGA